MGVLGEWLSSSTRVPSSDSITPASKLSSSIGPASSVLSTGGGWSNPS